MTTVLAIIMSVMILILAVLIAGVALYAIDLEKERESLRVIRREYIKCMDHLYHESRDEFNKDPMKQHNDIVNQHDLS